MKILVMYPYPLENDGLSLQGHYLVRGLRELGVEVSECDRVDHAEKQRIYDDVKPDAAIGIGFWGNTPELVMDPLKNGITPVPWFNANGWIANYQDVLNKLPLIVATSNWVKSTYMRDGLKGDNIHPCSIGFNPDIFFPKNKNDPEIKKLRSDLGIKDDEIMIFTAGGDVTSKGAQEMFRALDKIDKEFSNWKYVLKTFPSFSAENHGEEETKLMEELGLDKNKFIYISKDYSPEKMASLLQACDIYAAPSRLEGFGMVQLEAQACGKPVISINVGGPRDIVKHNETGFLADVEYKIKLDREWVYPHMGFNKKMQIEFPIPKTFAYKANIDQLAESTLKLMKDPDLREKMGKAAEERALREFHYKVIAQRMIDLIQKNVIESK